jgi:hypothetical protein
LDRPLPSRQDMGPRSDRIRVILQPSDVLRAWGAAYLGAGLGLCVGIAWMGAKLARDG